MSSSQTARIEEVIDATGDDDRDHASDSDDEPNVGGDGPNGSASSPSTSKKKKKKKSKAARALNALRGKSEIPQELVSQVLDQVRAGGAPGSEEADEATVRLALEELKIMDVAKGKAGLGGVNKKDMGEHKVRLRIGCQRVQNVHLPSYCSSGLRSPSPSWVRLGLVTVEVMLTDWIRRGTSAG